MHIPEKWFPGCLDLYLNSHNIMHILVVIAVYSMHKVKLIFFYLLIDGYNKILINLLSISGNNK